MYGRELSRSYPTILQEVLYRVTQLYCWNRRTGLPNCTAGTGVRSYPTVLLEEAYGATQLYCWNRRTELPDWTAGRGIRSYPTGLLKEAYRATQLDSGKLCHLTIVTYRQTTPKTTQTVQQSANVNAHRCLCVAMVTSGLES